MIIILLRATDHALRPQTTTAGEFCIAETIFLVIVRKSTPITKSAGGKVKTLYAFT